MAGTNEKILLNYLHEIEYNNDLLNEIGSNTSLTLRTAETPAAGTASYVRKFGTPVSVTACSAISDLPVGQTMVVYALDGTELGRKTAAGAFTAGSAVTAQGVYIELSGAATVVTSPESITLTGLGVHPLVMATETLGATALRLYVSETTSTYYDAAMMHGGARHTPVAGDEDLPYFDISTAYATLAGARVICHVLDSATYDEDLTSAGQSLDTASTFLQAALGQTPTITRGVGARVTREMINQGNNADTAYVSGELALGGVGTYQDPYTTIAAAFAGIGARTNIHIMDSETYIETLALNAAVTIEPIYGKIPVISRSTVITNVAVNIYGINYNSNLADDIGIEINITHTGIIEDCTGLNWTNGFIKTTLGSSFGFAGTIQKNLIYSNGYGIWLHAELTTACIIRKNIIHSNSLDGLVVRCDTAITFTSTIDHNLIYKNAIGVKLKTIGAASTLITTMANNTITQNTTGIYTDETVGAINGTYRDMIVYNNTTLDLDTLLDNPTINESNYGTNNGWAIGGTCITSNPKFCKITAPYQFGISADSEAYREDTSSDDMGAHLRIIEINASDVTVNGFIIDGQSTYNESVFIADAVDHTGMIIIWNTIESFNGIGLDPYDDDTDTDAIIKNNIIRDCGNGIKLSYGGNIVEENLIYNNTIYGIYAQRTVDGIIHNTITGNQYGLYLDTTVSGMTVRDNIFSQNSANDIYSNVNIIITYNCTDSALTDNVTALPDTNVLASPLFVDIADNDYNIKTIETGFTIDSQCKDAASDGQDIGAWDISRSVEDEAWRKYQLAWNPRKLDPEYNGKGVSKFENALGITNIFEKAHLRVYPFQWSPSQASTEELWKKIQYLSSLVPDRDQGRTADQCRIRVNPLPSQLLASGTAATISAATKTILDTNLDLTEDELKGFWASIKFLSGTGMTIDAALKTGTVAGTPWTVNQHVDRYVHDSGYYYRALSNTSNVVTLSDPNDTLTSGTIVWAFEKYFKMIKTENQILHLQDDDGELPSGSYDWYCDFIEMHVVKPNFKTLQERFYWLQETWKTGFKLILEEL